MTARSNRPARSSPAPRCRGENPDHGPARTRGRVRFGTCHRGKNAANLRRRIHGVGGGGVRIRRHAARRDDGVSLSELGLLRGATAPAPGSCGAGIDRGGVGMPRRSGRTGGALRRAPRASQLSVSVATRGVVAGRSSKSVVSAWAPPRPCGDRLSAGVESSSSPFDASEARAGGSEWDDPPGTNWSDAIPCVPGRPLRAGPIHPWNPVRSR